MKRLKVFHCVTGVTLVILFLVGVACANNPNRFDERSASTRAIPVEPVEPSAPATPPDASSAGVIYFVHTKRDNDLNIETIEFYKIDPAGANLTLIHSFHTEGSAAGFFVSPDGKKIVYSGYPENDVYVISVDGGPPVNLTNTPEWVESNPTWSPDGQRIAYDREPYPPPDPLDSLLSKRDIYTMHMDGTDPLNLTHNPAQQYSYRPVWSPDGQRLAFIASKPEGDLAITDLYLINAAGINPVNLTASLDNDPTSYEWSADGQQLKFSTFDDNSYIVNADGTGLVQVNLPRLPGSDFSGNLQWSPDGQRMSLCGYTYPYCALFTMNPDGTNLTRISGDDLDIAYSAWSPDRRQLVFAATLAEPGRPRSALYVVNPATLSGRNGLQQPRLTEADFEEIGPVRWWASPAQMLTPIFSTVTPPPSAPTPLPCDTYTAAVELSASATTLRVGEVVTVTVTLRNQGCSQLGLPRYSLQATPSLFDPARPDEVTHPWVVEPGQADTVEFVWRAVKEGQVTVTAGVWFEVLDDPGPPLAADYITEHLVITVIPPAEPSTLPATVPPTKATIVTPQLDPTSQLQGSVDAVFNQDELLYLNVGPTLAILDLTTPLKPELVGTVDLPVSSVSDITVANGYAYLAADEAGLRIVDLSNLANPVEVGNYQPPLRGFARWEGPAPYGPDTPRYLYAQGARSVAVGAAPDGRIYAYVAAQGAGLRIVDVTNPAAPSEIGFYQTPGDAVDVAVANGLAYVAAFEAGLRIIDVSQPAAPKEVGSLVRPDEGWFLGVTAVDHSVYLGEGHCSNDFGCSGFLKGMDASNPAAPTVIWHKAGVGPITHIINAGDYAYAVGWDLVSIDMTNPAQPVFYSTGISYIDYSSAYEANFIKQAAAATGYLYLAAGEAGLRIMDVSDPVIPVEVNTLFAPQR